MAAAFGEAAAEAAAGRDAGAGRVAAAGCRRVAASADYAAEAVASPAAIVVVVRDEEGQEAAVAVRALLDALLVGKIGAELVVDDAILLVNAALHLGLAAAGEDGE